MPALFSNLQHSGQSNENAWGKHMTATEFRDAARPPSERGERHTLHVGQDEREIAVRLSPPASAHAPGLQWLGGWRSDMMGSKALTLDALARAHGWSCLRHDYSGHGESAGDLRDGTISRWTEESLAVLDAYGEQRAHLLCGSSMGAWVALRMALALKAAGRLDEVVGLLLIAPAPDFVTRLQEPRLTQADRQSLDQRGFWEEHSHYSDEPNIWTRDFMEDGRDTAVLNGPLSLGVPVHIIQGKADNEVPLSHAETLLAHLPDDEATMSVVRGGDHRLSRDEDLALIRQSAVAMIERWMARPSD